MMIELARELRTNELVHLGRISEITGLSNNYLSQLAISLKNANLIKGVSGKKGGYRLAKPVDKISVAEIVQTVIGPINITDCVNDPNICKNSTFCETRAVWTIINSRIQQTLEELSLSDMIDRDWLSKIKQEHSDIPLLFPDQITSPVNDGFQPGCPTSY